MARQDSQLRIGSATIRRGEVPSFTCETPRKRCPDTGPLAASTSTSMRRSVEDAESTHPVPVHVSFVVSTHRRPQALRETLVRLQALDYPRAQYEVIVVDDGPDHSTRRMVAELGAGDVAITYLAQQNAGVARARNLGAARARGELLIFLDDDILVEPDHVARHLAVRETYGDCLVNGHWEFAPELMALLQQTPFGRFRLGVEDWVKAGISKEPIGDGRLRPSGVTACNLSISASRFRAIGGFDESFPFAGCEDQDFSYRSARAGFEFVYDPAIRLLHNDQRVDLQQFGARQRRGALTSTYLVARHPEAFADRALLLENAPATRFDPARLRAKKWLKRLYSTRLVMGLAVLISRALERLAPESRLLARIYTMTIGAHIFMGIREGLARLPEARVAAVAAAQRRYGGA